MDFATPDAKTIAITMSENHLEGRKLLIKDGEIRARTQYSRPYFLTSAIFQAMTSLAVLQHLSLRLPQIMQLLAKDLRKFRPQASQNPPRKFLLLRSSRLVPAYSWETWVLRRRTKRFGK